MTTGRELTVIGGTTPRKRVAGRRDWTNAKEAKFLAALSETCNVTLAAKLARVGNTTVYARRAKDAAFRDGWSDEVDVPIGEASEVYRVRILRGGNERQWTMAVPGAGGRRG